MTLRDLLFPVQSAILSKPLRVLAASAVLVVIALALGSGVEFRSSRSELAPLDDPDQRRWNALLAEYGGSEALIACVEGLDGRDASAPSLARFADRLADSFREDPRIDQVFHRMDLSWFERHGLHLMGRETLQRLDAVLTEESSTLGRLEQAGDLTGVNLLLAQRLEQGFASGAELPEGGAAALQQLTNFLAFQQRFLLDPAATVDAFVGRGTLLDLAGSAAAELGDGYLKTRDGKTLFLIVTPLRHDDDLDFRRELVGAMRARAAEVATELPGFRVAFTGQPALVVDEMDTVRSDTRVTSLFAAVGVTLLTLLVFRWKTHALLVLAALGAGVIWAYGAVRLELGYLNMITSSFISTLIGVGVAYGIHPVSEYELQGAHTGDPVRAVREAFHRTGAGVAVGALTTSAAFFSVQLMRFRGFSELGIVAGVGVLLCLLATAITLPALLVVYGTWRKRRDGAAGPERSWMDRVWAGHLAERVCRWPRLTSCAAILATALMAWAAAGLTFSTDILDLLPRDAESLRYQRRMLLDSDLSPFYNIVVAEDLPALRAMRRRAGEEPSIKRFVSVLDVLPPDDAATEDSLRSLRTAVQRARLPVRSAALDPPALAASYSRLEAALEQASEAAFTAGLGAWVEPLEAARGIAEECAATASAADGARVAEWNAGQVRLLEWSRGILERTRAALEAPAPDLASLPEEWRRRFLTRSGQLLGFLHPRSSVFDAPSLEEYVAASRRVSESATGFPLVFHKMAGRITQGFYRAVAVGSVLVLLILLLDYRSLRDGLLAVVPLAMGVVWMMGGMRLLGLSFNFANLVAVPLIIGVGIDNGVHVIHRVRQEGREGMAVVLHHTGRAIVIASLTTMVGFGSLGLASHRGLASLGWVLLLGVGACLVTSTLVLPNLLVWIGRAER